MIIALLMITNKHTQSAPTEKHAMKQAQSNETILIIPADKGHGAFMLDMGGIRSESKSPTPRHHFVPFFETRYCQEDEPNYKV